ncbi:MAG: Metallopeptidase [uncultured Pyrinomonadaceae bacterium]|uniref:Metallopeptidase n=1 Tax=uncultured Pyrinomonadaceae bacterium TaxID=2283094 RepID=A0A6J4PJM7_9BACT|nr:MAG: Metallopeptidase [uncultured Pyrinomonadaceae bacterium]
MFKSSLRFAAALIVFLSVCATVAVAQNVAFDVTRMDDSVEACTDFFQYANGNWIKKTEIPAAYSRWGSFNILAENNNNALRGILDANAKTKAAPGSNEQLIGDYYAACMDEAAIEKAGVTPLNPYFKDIDKIKDAKDLQRQIAMMHAAGIPALFGFGAGPDAKNSSLNIANTSQGGLSLPDRDFYTKDDPKSVETRTKFVEYMTNTFKLLGDDTNVAAANAKTVLAIQTRLANASRTRVEMRDPQKRYNKRTLTQLGEMTPNFSWTDYMTARNVPTVTEINVGQPDFFAEVNRMLTDVSINDWKTYLRWMTINSAAPLLSKAFVDENFNFYSRYLTGTKEQQPRWRRCVGATDSAVGEALGAEYVKKAFTPQAQKRMSELIDNLFAAYRESIPKLDWMSPETREKALAKLNTYQRKIGFNEKPRGYAGLKIDRQSFFQNSRAIGQFNINRNLKDINQKVDRTRWGMTPPTVNAYYNASYNEIVFPAGILQPPFFNQNADDAINYGAIGAVIGHEITHGFDDGGSQYDAEGNLKMWWTPEDRKKFEERSDCVVNQFGGYQIQEGLNINGKLTLGENIADLGGLAMAYAAYQKSLEGKPKPANIDGFTPEQRFFLGYAQIWAAKSTEAFERQQVLTDSHSNARYRVNGPLSNLPQFAQAFSCKQGDKMVRDNFCKIW